MRRTCRGVGLRGGHRHGLWKEVTIRLREPVALVGVIYQEPSIACGEPHGRKEGPGDSHSEDERPIIKHVGCSVLEGVCAARRAPAQRRAPAASRAAAPTAAPTTATRGGKAEGIE